MRMARRPIILSSTLQVLKVRHLQQQLARAKKMMRVQRKKLKETRKQLTQWRQEAIEFQKKADSLLNDCLELESTLENWGFYGRDHTAVRASMRRLQF